MREAHPLLPVMRSDEVRDAEVPFAPLLVEVPGNHLQGLERNVLSW